MTDSTATDLPPATETPLSALSEPVETQPASRQKIYDFSNDAPLDPTLYVNRELSWLAFNQRVIEEAKNPRHPLLERLRFLSISANNLDEFYMVRVAGLQGQVREGVRVLSADGHTPTEQLESVNRAAGQLMSRQQAIWTTIRNQLHDEGLIVLQPKDVNKTDHAWLEKQFESQLFPVLTPLAIDPAHPFPFIPNLGFSIVLKLTRRRDARTMYALVPIPTGVKRFWEIEAPARKPGETGPQRRKFISLENFVSLFLGQLFPGFDIVSRGLFRILRDSDIELEEEAEDLVREFEALIKQRRLGSVVRVEIDASMPEDLRDFITGHLHAKAEVKAHGKRRRGKLPAPARGQQHVLAAHFAAVAGHHQLPPVDETIAPGIAVMARLQPTGAVALLAGQLNFADALAQRAIGHHRGRIAVGERQRRMRGGAAQPGDELGGRLRDGGARAAAIDHDPRRPVRQFERQRGGASRAHQS